MNLFNLFAKLTLDTSGYDKGLKSAEKSGASFASKLGTAFKAGAKVVTGFITTVIAAGTAVAALAGKTISLGDSIDKNAQKLGLSTKAYQQWSIAAQLAGTDASTLQTGIRQLTKFTEDLSKGTGDSLLTLQKLGIGYEDFMSMGFDDQLKTVVTAMQGLEDATEKTRVAQELFGSRAYQELMPLLNQEAGSIDELFASFEDLGLIIGDDVVKESAALNDQLTLMKTKASIVASDLMSQLYPAMEQIFNGLIGIASGSDQAVDSLTDGFLNIINEVAEATPVLVEQLAELVIKLINGLTQSDVLSKLVKSLVAVVNDILLTITEPSFLNSFIDLLLDLTVSLIQSLVNVDWSKILVNLVDVLFDTVFSLLENPELITSLIDLGIEIIKALFDAMVKYAGRYLDMLSSGEFWSKLLDFGKKVGIGLVNAIIDGLNMLANFTIPGLTIGEWKLWDDTRVSLFNIPHIGESGSSSSSSGANSSTNQVRVTLPDGTSLSKPKASNTGRGSGGRYAMADGGMFEQGNWYLAGESGAELVASSAHGTGVTNIDQFTEAMFNAMKAYDLRGMIASATQEVIESILTKNNMVVQIGDREFNAYVFDTVESGLSRRGLKSLSDMRY